MQVVTAILAFVSLFTTCSAKMLLRHAGPRTAFNSSLQKSTSGSNTDWQSQPWVVEVSKFPNTLTLSGLIKIDQSVQTSGTLAAFVRVNGEEELRGVQSNCPPVPFGPYQGYNICQMTIYGEGQGDPQIYFKYKVEGTEKVADLTFREGQSSLDFKSNEDLGSVVDPVLFDGSFPVVSPSEWICDYAAYENSMTMDVVVEIDGEKQTGGKLAAFFKGEVRGVTSSPVTPPMGPYSGQSVLYPITLYDDAQDGLGPSLSFKFKPTGDKPEVEIIDEIHFKPNGHIGNANAPHILVASTKCVDYPKKAAKYASGEFGWSGPEDEACSSAATFGLCASNKYKKKISKLCKKTCGPCPAPPPPPCDDDDVQAGIWAESKGWGSGLVCAHGKNLCTNSNEELRTTMEGHCPKTCGKCR